jgi:hypothetical protein
MTTQELFGVVVRTIGLVLFLAGVLAFLVNPIAGAGYALMGLAVIAGANWIVGMCYSPKWSFPRVSALHHGAATPPTQPGE